MVRQQTINQSLSILGLASRFSPMGEAETVKRTKESFNKTVEKVREVQEKFEKGQASIEAAERAKIEEQARQAQYSPSDWVKHFEEKKAATQSAPTPEQVRLRDKEQVQQYKEQKAKEEFEVRPEEEKFYLEAKKFIMGGDNNV